MCVHTRVPGSACQTLAFTVWYVLLGLRVPVLFGQPEVDNVHLIGLLPQANEEVVGLDIAVDEILRMDVLNTVDHLVGQHEDRLQAELAAADVEQVFQGRPKQVHHHDIVVSLHVAEVHAGDARHALEVLEELCLVHEHRVLRLGALQLHRELLPGLRVYHKVDVAEGAAPELAPEKINAAHLPDAHMLLLAHGACGEAAALGGLPVAQLARPPRRLGAG
mmetsp:Transcript_103033/g.272266  ORF Transcript_103033/g.272266 Transcript_103033/m.272266 type:complete len:220 (+) Transcript_103033:685-1344(+)